MTRAYDVVVIGAGPAGALSALLAARAGAGVLLVDRSAWPRDKVCGCCLAPRGQDALGRAGIAEDVLGGGRARLISRVTVRTPGRAASFAVPAYATTRRREMDAVIVEAARDAGAHITHGVRATIDRRGGLVRLGAGDAVRFRAAVVADGLGGSSLKGDPAFGWRTRPESHVGLGGVAPRWPGEGGDGPHAITMHTGPEGYVGVAPLPGGAWAVAGAVSPRAVRTEGGPVGVMGRVLAAAGGDPGLLVHAAITGTPALTRRRTAVEAEGRVFVVGDASSYVEPFTGEGMSWALSGALALSPLVLDAVAGRYRPGTWTRITQSEAAEAQRGCRAVASLLRRPRMLSAAVAAMACCPPIGAMAGRAVVGRGAPRPC